MNLFSSLRCVDLLPVAGAAAGPRPTYLKVDKITHHNVNQSQPIVVQTDLTLILTTSHCRVTLKKVSFLILSVIDISLASPDQFANVYYSGTSQFIFDFQEVLSTGADQNASGRN